MPSTPIALISRLSEGPGRGILTGRQARHVPPADLDRLLALRVLEELEPADSWPTCAGCECGIPSRPIEPSGRRWIAACPSNASADVALDADDIRQYAIDDLRIARLIAGKAQGAVEVHPGLWRLYRSVERDLLFTLRRAVVQDPALPHVVRDAGSRAAIVLVAPVPSAAVAARLEAAGIRTVDVAGALSLATDGSLALDAAAVHPTPSARLTVMPGGTILVDGVEKSIPANALRLLKLLVAAWRRGEAVSKTTVEEEFGRQPAELISELRGALSAGHPEAGSIRNWITVEKRPTSYRLTLRKDEIAIFD